MRPVYKALLFDIMMLNMVHVIRTQLQFYAIGALA